MTKDAREDGLRILAEIEEGFCDIRTAFVEGSQLEEVYGETFEKVLDDFRRLRARLECEADEASRVRTHLFVFDYSYVDAYSTVRRGSYNHWCAVEGPLTPKIYCDICKQSEDNIRKSALNIGVLLLPEKEIHAVLTCHIMFDRYYNYD